MGELLVSGRVTWIRKQKHRSPSGKKKIPGNLLAPWRAEILGAHSALEEVTGKQGSMGSIFWGSNTANVW